MKTELISNSLETLAITSKNVVSTATVAREYRRIFEDVSTKLLVRCLKFLLKKMREVVITKQEKEVWTRFWALVNSAPALKESLAETPLSSCQADFLARQHQDHLGQRVGHLSSMQLPTFTFLDQHRRSGVADRCMPIYRVFCFV